jgi:WD40-like Beta Propeller Repeat
VNIPLDQDYQDYPRADRHFAQAVRRLTRLDVRSDVGVNGGLAGYETKPAFSPDGSTIAYIADYEGPAEPCRRMADSRAAMTLTKRS